MSCNNLQAVLMASSDCISSPAVFLRVYMHEASRVYGDKLISLAEQEAFQRILKEQALQHAQVRNYFWRDDFCMYQVTVFLKLSFSYIMGKFQLFIPA